MNDVLKQVRRIVNAPNFMEPWLDRFYEPHEVSLLLALEEEGSLTVAIEDNPKFIWEQNSILNSDQGDAGQEKSIYRKEDLRQKEMERSWKRGVLDRVTDVDIAKKNTLIYQSANFHTRYDIWAVFEGFKDLPDDIRHRLNQWEFEYYCQTHEETVKQVRQSGDPDIVNHTTPRYLLLDEALQVLDRVERIYLWPCNCRSMIQKCRKPLFTCLRFENNRGIGFEISREKAKIIVQDANKNGLMQSGELGRDENGRLIGAICNCCADCCFPHWLSREKGAEKIWPFSRYVVRYDENKCTLCGMCSKRCPFGAILFQRKTKVEPASLSLIANLCRGCGVCATGCPANAISMELDDHSQ